MGHFAREKCLHNTETRTSPLWQLAYGLRLIGGG